MLKSMMSYGNRTMGGHLPGEEDEDDGCEERSSGT